MAFDWQEYLRINTDVAKDAYFGSSLEGAAAHYEQFGRAEGRAWTGTWEAPASAFIVAGPIHNEPPPSFDWQYYASQNTDLTLAGINTEAEALNHYRAYGYREGRVTSAPKPISVTPTPITPKVNPGGFSSLSGGFNPVDWTVSQQTIAQKDPKETQLTVAARNAWVPIIYGHVRVGPKLAYVATDGGNLVMLNIWGHGPLDSITEKWVDDKASPAGVSYQDRLGTATDTPTTLITGAVPSGIAYSVVSAAPGENAGFPRLNYYIKGLKVHDPRVTPGAISAYNSSHDINVKAWSDNPALCLADFITNTVYGMGKQVDWESVANVANFNDTIIGAEKSRTLNFVMDTVQASSQWIDALRLYASCWVVEINGLIRLIPDKAGTSVKTFSHASGNILGIGNIQKKGVMQIPNYITINYNDVTGVPHKSNAIFYDMSGTDSLRETSLTLPGINRATQANREAIERLKKLLYQDLSFDIDTFDEGIAIEIGDIVSVYHPIGVGSVGAPKEMRVMAVQASSSGRYKLSLLEYTASVYDTSTITATTTPDTVLPNPYGTIAPVTSLTATEEIYQSSDGTVGSRIRTSWTGATDYYPIEYKVRVTRMDDSGGLNSLVVRTGDLIQDNSYVISPLEDSKYYKIEVWTKRLNSSTILSTVASYTVQALGKLLPPGNVATFQEYLTPSGLVLGWTPVVDIDMAGYKLREDSTVLQVLTALNTNLGFLVPGSSHNYSIVAYDRSSNESAAPNVRIVNIPALAPITSLAVNNITGDSVLTWVAPATNPWPIAYYEVRYGGTGWGDSTLLDKVSTTRYVGAANYLGPRTYRIKAVDVAGYTSTEVTVVSTINAPGALSITADIFNVTVALSYPTPSSSLPIKEYRIRYGASWATGADLVTTTANIYNVDVDWINGRTFWIKAYDIRGNASTESSASVTINVPSAPTISHSIILDTLKLSWTGVTSSLPIKDYEIRYGGTDWSSATSFAKVLGSTFETPVNWGGDRVFRVAAYDANNNPGATTASQTVTISPPTAPIVTSQVIDNNVLLYWSGATGTLPISTYEVRKGDAYAGSELIGEKSGGFTTILETIAGEYKYWVTAKDSANNYGTPAFHVASVSQPPDYILNANWDSPISENLLKYSSDFNNVIWGNSGPCTFTTGISDPFGGTSAMVVTDDSGVTWEAVYQSVTIGQYERVCGSVFVKKDSTAATTRTVLLRVHFTGGTTVVNSYLDIPFATDTGLLYGVTGGAGADDVLVSYGVEDYSATYWRVYISGYSSNSTTTTATLYLYPAVGTNAGYAAATTGSVTVAGAMMHTGTIPLEYLRTYNHSSNFSNVAVDLDRSRVLGVNNVQTWEDHFTSNGWATPQAQVNSGNTIYIQPATVPAFYEEIFNYGSVLSSTKITVTKGGNIVSGTPVLTSKISTSLDGNTWVDYDGMWSIYGTNFQYVKVRVTVDSGQYDLGQLTVNLDSKIINDSGSTTVSATGGTVANFNIEFVDVTSITVTASGTTFANAIYDFKDSIIAGTYSVTSNVMTVNCTAHSLVAGQNVRLSVTSGTAPTIGVYSVASVTNANTYLVNITTANTSGNISMYPEGFRIYLFDAAGTEISGRTASWSIRGY